MAKDQKYKAEEAGEAIESALGKTEMFFEKHGKQLLIVLGVIVICISGYFAYTHLLQKPKQERASAEMFDAQRVLSEEDYESALKGTASYAGFEELANKYSGLPQGNLAKHYAGICNLYMGNFEVAISYFESFKEVKGATGTLITAQNYGLMGDAYVELGNMEKGLSMYEKAVDYSANEETTPKYLKKAAMINCELKNYSKAIEQYKRIKFEFPSNYLARDIDKYIAMVEQMM